MVSKVNVVQYLILSPDVELQFETATNHHRSRAVLKFRVPRHLMNEAADPSLSSDPETVSFSKVHPDTTTSVVRFTN